MTKILVLDDVQVRGLTLILQDDSSLKVEATYNVTSSGNMILTKTVDITKLFPAGIAAAKGMFTQARIAILPTETM